MGTPFIFVLAGVNGAGKSSVGGSILRRHGGDWYNPDDFARNLRTSGYEPDVANSLAWKEGVDRLGRAITLGENFAFETTLGGKTIRNKLESATSSHNIMIWYCGLETAEMHIERVRLRVSVGGHDIPTEKIRSRFDSSRENIIHLMPFLAKLRVYDNSKTVQLNEPIPDPSLVLKVDDGALVWPCASDREALNSTPGWAKPILEKALSL